MMSDEQTVEVVRREGCAVVYPRGYLNGATGEKLDRVCGDLLQQGNDRIVINFSRTETINTMGVANLVAVLEKVGRDRGAVCFSDLLPTNRRMLDVLDISRGVLVFDHETDALRHLCESAD